MYHMTQLSHFFHTCDDQLVEITYKHKKSILFVKFIIGHFRRNLIGSFGLNKIMMFS